MNSTEKKHAPALLATNAAKSRLVKAHQDEYNELLSEERKNRGLFATPEMDRRTKTINNSIARLKELGFDVSTLEAQL